MSACAWPDKACPRPVRANAFCGRHDVMWARRHGREKAPKRRGTKARRLKTDDWASAVSKPRLVGLLLAGPMPLHAIRKSYGVRSETLFRDLRKLEASGLRIERTANPDNAREVLRHVTEVEVLRWMRSLSGAGQEAR